MCADHQVPVVAGSADVNARDKNERTALQLAVAVNRPRVARCLIDAGGQLL